MRAPDRDEFRKALLDHFERTRRDLPWRSQRTPYRVLVSEFMLQQTRADTVAPYYVRWVRRFPGWEELADASWDDVMRQWKGLGYYARARNLHRTATLVRERHGGRLPRDPTALQRLPGVGEYTAGAVASIAFGLPVAAVDGNVRRVLGRLLDEGDPSPARLRAEAARLVDPSRPGDFNEAMMELGATVCTPRRPSCGACPVARWCRARAAGTAPDRPLPRPRRKPRRASYAVAVALDEAGRTLLTRRPAQGLLAGTWEFPARELAPDGGDGPLSERAMDESPTTRAAVADAALRRLAELQGRRPGRGGARAREALVHAPARRLPSGGGRVREGSAGSAGGDSRPSRPAGPPGPGRPAPSRRPAEDRGAGAAMGFGDRAVVLGWTFGKAARPLGSCDSRMRSPPATP